MKGSDSQFRRVIVCGSRAYTNRSLIRTILGELVPASPTADEPTIVHGACPAGADKIAGEEALDLGLWVEPHPADWGKYGDAAGPIRNREMAVLGADVCLAFGDGQGTRHMVRMAEQRGIPVRRYP